MAHIECFLTNFCWRDRCGFETWLNFTRVASRPLFLEHLIEILSKELIQRQMVERRGSTSKFESFCCGCFCLIARVVRSMRGYLVIRSFVVDAFLVTLGIFHSACNFGIIRLNDKILPENEQNLKFLKRITKHIFGKKRLVKFRLAPY